MCARQRYAARRYGHVPNSQTASLLHDVCKQKERHACAAAGAGSSAAGGARAGPRHVRRAAVARLEPRAQALVERPDVVVALQREAVVAHAVEPLVRGDPPQPAGVRVRRRERANCAALQHRGVVRHAVAALAGALLLRDACACAARARPGHRCAPTARRSCSTTHRRRQGPPLSMTSAWGRAMSVQWLCGAVWCGTACYVSPGRAGNASSMDYAKIKK